jgi:hypothetical protein
MPILRSWERMRASHTRGPRLCCCWGTARPWLCQPSVGRGLVLPLKSFDDRSFGSFRSFYLWLLEFLLWMSLPFCLLICHPWVHLLGWKTSDQFFAKRLPCDCSFVLPATSRQLGVFFRGRRWSTLQPYCTASNKMTASTNAMSSSVGSGRWICYCCNPLFSIIKIMITGLRLHVWCHNTRR